MLMIIAISACKKEKFPKPDDLIGTWYSEKDSNYYVAFTSNIFSLTRGNETSTARYTLDKDKKQIILDWDSNPPNRVSTKITYNKNNQTLTIYGLSISQENQSVDVFKKR